MTSTKARTRFAALALVSVAGVAAADLALRFPTARAEGAGKTPQTYQTSPLPTPAMDTMKIAGTVEVMNTPTVNAQQTGTWIVGLAGPQAFTVSPPSFIASGRTYTFSWPTGKSETARVVEIKEDGWVQVAGTGQPGTWRWLNPAMALAVEEVR